MGFANGFRRLVGPALAAVGVACSGCALVDINVAYPGPTQEPRPKVGSGREIVLRLPFADQRKISDRCGMQKNSYNIDTADVICPGPPAPWFGTVLSQELRARGFLVATAGSGGSADPLVIEGAVQKLFAEPIAGFFSTKIETDFQVELVASSPSGLLAERRFFVKGTNSVFLAGDSGFEASLHQASRLMIEEIVSGIVQLMDQYPTLGRAPEQS